MKFLALMMAFSIDWLAIPNKETIPEIPEPTQEEIDMEIEEGLKELVAQVAMAEAGDQGLDGIRLVVDVILNRVDSDRFPDTIEEVIYQKSQFSVMWNGAFEKAGWYICDEVYEAIEMEWDGERMDDGVLFFSATDEPVNGVNAWKFGDHWFSY